MLIAEPAESLAALLIRSPEESLSSVVCRLNCDLDRFLYAKADVGLLLILKVFIMN